MTIKARIAFAAAAVSLALAGPAPALADSFSADQREEIGKIIKDYLLTHPEVMQDVMAELENPGTYRTIRALISRCAGLVVLVDVIQVVADGKGQELSAMQLISYLDALTPRKRKTTVTACVTDSTT